MGCGSSTVGVTDQEVNSVNTKSNNTQNNEDVKHMQNGHSKSVVEKKNEENAKKKKKTDPNANIDSVASNNPVPKAVAFEVAFNDNILLKTPPRRLQKLEPLALPKLTPEMLAEKQRIAEEKREKARQRKLNASRKSSKRRKELMKAKEFEQEQVQQQTSQIEEQLRMAEMKRVARLEEIKNKQKLKEERAKRARERAKKLNQDEPELELEVEKDDNYNASDDSWLGEEEEGAGMFGSPRKKHNTRVKQTMSASTVDSFDQAFSKKPVDEILKATDDFFDS